MKKLLLILAAIAAIAALGGFAYVLMFMEEDPDTLLVGGSSDPGSLPDAQLNLPREVETQADVLDALDYETKQNQDTVGWITIPGTRVNNSVLQAHDNIAYLRTNERKEASVYGCYFADAECNIGGREVLSPNVVIYGHSDFPSYSSSPTRSLRGIPRSSSSPPWRASWIGRCSRCSTPTPALTTSPLTRRAGWTPWPPRQRKSPFTTTALPLARMTTSSPFPPAACGTATTAPTAWW